MDWVDIPNFESYYQINQLGQVRSKERIVSRKVGKDYIRPSKKLTPTLKKTNGYYVINFTINGKSKQQYIHRLLALTFLDNPNNYQFINHKNGIKTDNSLKNLEWCTNKQNCIHASKNNLIPKGQNKYNSKLKDYQVRIIKKRLKNGESCANICKDFNVSNKVISEIKKGKNWKHIK